MLKRIFSLIRKTGDRVIIVDPESDDAFVIMPFDRYDEIMEEDIELDDEEAWVTSRHGHDTLGRDMWHDTDAVPLDESFAEEEPLPVPAHASADLTEGELIDKINHDIAVWKAEQEVTGYAREDAPEEAKTVLLNELTLAPLPDEEGAPAESGQQSGEEQFYIEPVG